MTKKNNYFPIHYCTCVFFIFFIIAACEGPIGPAGGTVITLEVDGTVRYEEIKEAITQAVEQARQANVEQDGSTAEKAFSFKVTGDFDLEDDLAMKILFSCIENYYIHLDLTEIQGNVYPVHPLCAGTNRAKILSIKLSDSVKTIAGSFNVHGAFSGFAGLREIDAPGVVKVGDFAFTGCIALQTVKMDNAEIICRGAFAQLSDNPNTVLTSINLPSAISVGEEAFVNCTAIQTVSMNNVQTIGELAFGNCYAIQTINMEKVEIIGDQAFWWNQFGTDKHKLSCGSQYWQLCFQSAHSFAVHNSE